VHSGMVLRVCSKYLLLILQTKEKRGDGAHVRIAFETGKKAGYFVDGDAVVCVHTMRNAEGVKQWTMRILNVSSAKPVKSELSE